MKYVGTFALAAMVALMPFTASAHEVQVFEIGGEEYQFVVGSLNEPVVVDDKTGVHLSVTMPEHAGMAANDHHGAAGAVEGLEDTLQVEISAGDAKKVLNLAPIHGEAGAYRAPFYPTVATTYSYRFFGTINETPVDLTFSCNPAGHGTAEEDTTEVEVSDGVTRISKTGSFGCPSPKEAMGFPEASASVRSLEAGKTTGNVALGFSVVALLLGGYAAARRK